MQIYFVKQPPPLIHAAVVREGGDRRGGREGTGGELGRGREGREGVTGGRGRGREGGRGKGDRREGRGKGDKREGGRKEAGGLL